MNLLDKVFFSGTFGGELLSLAAAKVVLTKVRDENVTGILSQNGAKLNSTLNNVVSKLNFKGLSLSGHPSWQFLVWDINAFKDLAKAKTLFMQEMFYQGILILGSHNMTLAHNDEAIQIVGEAYYKTLEKLQRVERVQSYNEDLLVEPLKPLFKAR